MNIIGLYRDFGVNYKTEGHKHCRPGWVQVPCPFCSGNAGYHLGYNLNEEYFFCWRCGWHPTIITVSKLLGTFDDTNKIIRQYEGVIRRKPTEELNKLVKLNKKRFKLPSHTTRMKTNHRNYLKSRNFDPDILESIFHLMGTGPISKLDGIDYKHRIIIPFYWDKKIVSFDSRSIRITDKKGMRYIACPKDRETMLHKRILYGRQDLWTDTGICVEGPADTWRFGKSAFATSGINFTPFQIREMAKRFKRIAIIYDNEIQATIQAKLLIAELKCRRVDAFQIKIEGDPGDLTQSDANQIVKDVTKKIY